MGRLILDSYSCSDSSISFSMSSEFCSYQMKRSGKKIAKGERMMVSGWNSTYVLSQFVEEKGAQSGVLVVVGHVDVDDVHWLIQILLPALQVFNR